MQTTKRFIRRKELIRKVGLSGTTIFRLEKADAFPQHTMLGARCAVWDESEIDAWMDAQKAKHQGVTRVVGGQRAA